jgi:hypothetical protein
MSNVYVEREEPKKYRAIQNKRVIATGRTQAEAAAKARARRPSDPILLERVRDTTRGGRDKWRHGFSGKD